MQTRAAAALVALLIVTSIRSARAQNAVRCGASDSASATAIRARLADWVSATNTGDRNRARDVWAPVVAGWFPSAGIFTDSAASAAAGYPDGKTPARTTTFAITVDAVDASGSIAAVHDLWTESRTFPNGVSTRRAIRGSELWKCSPDGQWRIARYVSAPEPWVVVR